MSDLRRNAALRISAAVKEAPAWLLRYSRPREFDAPGKCAVEYFPFSGHRIPIPSCRNGFDERGIYVSEATCAPAIICSGLRYKLIDDQYVAAYASLPKTNRKGPVVNNNLFPACLEVGAW
jgi:hypothetical protein